ncbi:MAG: hypothetical protein EAX95_04210 [Candidatus Thorarchaeota archaeon]|nr:hypothetical protein [Candidatus Thorarchaeota archaeon]
MNKLESIPLYWLLDIEAYDFDTGVLRNTDISGKAMIVSRQLWSIVRDDTVLSVLLGPGIFKGVAVNGNRRVDVLEYIGALMFNPSELRLDEPIPVVDIINPEVIDPMAQKRSEEIVTIIRKLIVEKGNVLAADPLAKVSGQAAVPQMAYYDEMIKKINVSHVSGVQRAKFILAGTNSPLYRPFVQHFEKRRYSQPDRLKVLATAFHKFTGFVDIEVMSNWTVVEKAGTDKSTGIEALRDEYDATLTEIQKNSESFLFEL